jgi:PAS domain S-box-containing protein
LKQLQTVLDLIGATPRAFLDKLRVGISLVDARTGAIQFANEEFTRILGVPLESLIGDQKTFLELTHPDDRERNAKLQRQLVAGEIERYELEKRYLRPDLSIVWARVSVEAIRRSGHAIWSIGLVEDISFRKVLEQKLDAVESVAAIATWNWAVKSDTTNISAAYNFIHGLPPATPAPSLNEALRHVHPEDRDAFRSVIAQGLARRTGYTAEYRIVLADGSCRWLRTTATCLYDASGDVANLVGATIDITDAKMRPSQPLSPAIRKVLAYIEAHWSEQISLSELGRKYDVSTRTIYNYFAAEGTTPYRYIKNIRLRHARHMLQHSSESTTVTSVALKCGFSNMGHFAKDYRVEFGEAPSQSLKAARDPADTGSLS